MVSSYTANLAMFLVIENKTSKIDSVDDLKDCGIEGMECPIKFGAKKGGATFAFFKVCSSILYVHSVHFVLILVNFLIKESTNPVFLSMFQYMENHPDVLTANNDEGIERVYNGEEDYAFLMESSSIEYVTERRCNLTQVGEPLDDKNYGIGMRKSTLEIKIKYHL